jgi:hypothetical protein
MRTTLLQLVLLITLVLSAAGIGIFTTVCINFESLGPLSEVWGGVMFCVLAAPVSLFWLRALGKLEKQEQRRPVLYVSDMIMMSLAVAACFTGVKLGVSDQDFIHYGILSSLALLAALLLALMHASRRGFSRGLPRVLHALSTTLLLLGAGGAGVFVFFSLILLSIGGLNRALDVLVEERLRPIYYSGILGVGALLCAFVLRRWAQREFQNHNEPQ